MQTVSIILADAQFLTREGLKQLLRQEAAYRVSGEAENERELLTLAAEKQPDVLIIDYNQQGRFDASVFEKIRRISPATRFMVLSDDNDKKTIYDVLERGVNSFLTKTCGEKEVLNAVKATTAGEKFFCSKVLDYLLEKSFARPEEESCAPTPLTPREIEIVRLVARGMIAKEIADMLSLSTHTVYTHRKNIMKKLNLSTSSELVLYAVNNGIVSQSGQ